MPDETTRNAASLPRYIDTGLAIHRPQTDKIRGRKYASSVHGYRGRVLTRAEALAAEVPLCDRCFPQGFNADVPDAIAARAARMSAR